MSSSSLIEQKQERDPGNVKSVPYPRSRSALGEWLRMLAVSGILGGLYVWRGGASLLFLLLATGILMLGGLVLQFCGPRRIKLVRTVTPARPIAGDTLQVRVQVSFTARCPLPWMVIADYWDGNSHQELLFPGFRRSFSYTYALEKVSRGNHQLRGCRVTWGDLPGWFTGRCEPEGEQQRIKVQPAPLYYGGGVREGDFIPGEAISSRRGRNDGGETLESRDYAPGDPLSRIHWKNSARRGSLQSKIPERERGRMTCIVLDNTFKSYQVPSGALLPRARRGDAPPAFEQAVSAAMGLLLSAEHSGSYVQLFSGGWPEGTARHEGLGRIPARVLDTLTEIASDGKRSLPELLDDASRSWIPGMRVSIITGQLEEATAKAIARFLVQGVKVELYYAWDLTVPAPGGVLSQDSGQLVARSVGDSLTRLGAELFALDDALPAYGYREVGGLELSGRPTLR